jgi:hypothetical protein
MNKSISEEKIISLITNTCKSIQASPVFKDKVLNLMLLEAQAISSPKKNENRVPILASALIVIAIVLIVYGFFSASTIK